MQDIPVHCAASVYYAEGAGEQAPEDKRQERSSDTFPEIDHGAVFSQIVNKRCSCYHEEDRDGPVKECLNKIRREPQSASGSGPEHIVGVQQNHAKRTGYIQCCYIYEFTPPRRTSFMYICILNVNRMNTIFPAEYPYFNTGQKYYQQADARLPVQALIDRGKKRFHRVTFIGTESRASC